MAIAEGQIENNSSVIAVSESELADYLGVSGRRIRQMVNEGTVEKIGAGKYDLKKSVQKYINFIKSKEKLKDENLEKLKISKEAETLMHERLRKRKTELIVQQMERKLHRAEDVEAVWNVMVTSAKSRITSIPVKTSPMLVGIEDPKEIQSILKREINEALNEISNYDVASFDKEFDEYYDEETDNE